MSRKVIDGIWDRENLKNINDNFYELFQSKGAQVSLLRNLMGSTDNLLAVPPLGKSIKWYASETNDPYYNGIMSLKTIPSISMNPDTSFDIDASGYFFYSLKAVDKLAPGQVMSLLVYTTSKDNNFKLEYIFSDVNGSRLQVNTVNETSTGVYLEEGIEIPANTNKIDIRLDNRSAMSTTKINKFIVIASEKFGLFNFDSNQLKYDLDVQSSEINAIKEKISSNKESNEKGVTISYHQPSEFNLKDHILKGKIYTDGKSKFRTDLDVSTLKNPTGQTYYVSGNGSNSNDGLSESNPLADIYAAMKKTDVNTIMIDGNYTYYRSSGYAMGEVSNNINIIGYNGKPRIIAADSLNFSKTSGYTNVYQASRSAVSRIINVNETDDNGDYIELKKVNSISEVEQSPNSWFTSSGIVYVNYSDEQIDNHIACLMNINLLRISGDYNVYLENLEFVGGSRNIRYETSTGSLVMNDVKLSYSSQSNGNGLEMVGGTYVISYKCESSKQMMDGFNYHKGANGELPYFIEIDCIGRDNGFEQGTGGSKSNNGSTAHDGIKGIRLNGLYARNDGGNVADVNVGTQTWNLGVVAFDSYQNSDFQIAAGGQQFLDSCEGFGSQYSIQSLNEEDKFCLRRMKIQSESVLGTKTIY